MLAENLCFENPLSGVMIPASELVCLFANINGTTASRCIFCVYLRRLQSSACVSLLSWSQAVSTNECQRCTPAWAFGEGSGPGSQLCLNLA